MRLVKGNHIDWMKYSKTVFRYDLPNDYDINIYVAMHESGKITVNLAVTVSIGVFDLGKVNLNLKGDFVKRGDMMHLMNQLIKQQNEV